MYKKLLILVLMSAIVLSACGTLEVAMEEMPVPEPTVTSSPLPSIPPTRTPTLPPQEYFKEISGKWRVAFFAESSKQICVVNGEGDERVCLDLNDDHFSGRFEQSRGSLALSPDGNKVAYATEWNIYIWTIGGIVTPLRNENAFGNFRELKWSPDGNFIAYISGELQRGCPNCQAYFGDVFIEGLYGEVPRALTTNLTGHSDDPDWSPDGKSIAFTHRRLILDSQNKSVSSVSEEIYVIAVEGNSPIVLTKNPADDKRPQWSPDGKRIAFLSNRGDNQLFDLYLMNSDGSGVRKAADLAIDYMWPYSNHPFTWLPDGRFILYHYTLIDTFTGKKEAVSLPFVSIDASWGMESEDQVIPPSPTPDCAGGWSQLRAGIEAVVTTGPNDSPIRVRAAPGTSAETLAQFYPGRVVQVLEGPICIDELIFWKIESELIPGGVGWVAEGDMMEYWLEPYNP